MSTSEVSQARGIHGASAGEPPAWWNACNEELDRFPGLPENWDSYGGAPPMAQRVAAAKRFLRELLRSAPRLSRPLTSPTPDGGVFLGWRSESHDLEVEAESDSALEYLYEDATTGRILEGTVTPPEAIPVELLNLFVAHFCE
jgi:hypothetical protein